MDATYERIFGVIDRKPPAERELARRILIWTAYARKPLSIYDLACAISIEMNIKRLEDLESSIPTETYIVDVCANLIYVDQTENKYVHFVHSSIKGFLTSHSLTSLSIGYEVGHREIAQACMIFLTLFPKRIDIWLHQYASDEWPHHLLAGNLNSLPADEQIVTLTLSFFEKRPLLFTEQPEISGSVGKKDETYLIFSPPLLALIFDIPGTQKGWPLYGKQLQEGQSKAIYDYDLECTILSNDHLAMHYVIAELDSVPMAQRLYIHGYELGYVYSDSGGNNSEVPDWLQLPPLYSVQSPQMARFLLDNDISTEPRSLRSTLIDPLEYFVQRGTLGVEVLKLLLGRLRAADQNGERFRRALQVAKYRGNVEAMRLLLNGAPDINAQDGQDDNALQVSLCATRPLLDSGADINPQDGEYGDPFLASVCTTQSLLDSGADINAQCGEYEDPSLAFVNSGLDTNEGGEFGDQSLAFAWQTPLDSGAAVSAHCGKYDNALQAAAYDGNIEIMPRLLDKGANVNIQGGTYGNALQTAVYNGNTEIIRLLLDTGADVNIQGGEYGNALRAAAYNGNTEIIRLLLDKGADVNIQGGTYDNALQAAAYNGNIEVIRLLLDKGANVNIQGGTYGNALQAAAYNGNIEVIRLLLDKGADVNIQGGVYGNALQAAAYMGEIEVIKLLLDRGADINDQSGMYGNALQASAYKGNIEAIYLLLEKGADINARGGMYGNALQAAAYNGNIQAIRLLLDKGADINAQSGMYGNALQAAAYMGGVEVIQVLLARGADLNAQGGAYGNALQAASYMGRFKAVELLLDKGANVCFQGGEYGTALQAALAPGPTHSWHRKDEFYVFDIAKLLVDRGADIAAYVPDSKYGDALTAAKLSGRHSYTLDDLLALRRGNG